MYGINMIKPCYILFKIDSSLAYLYLLTENRMGSAKLAWLLLNVCFNYILLENIANVYAS